MKKIYLTFDMDWADDEMMRFFYDTVCKLDIYGTLNVTNDSAVLDVIRARPFGVGDSSEF